MCPTVACLWAAVISLISEPLAAESATHMTVKPRVPVHSTKLAHHYARIQESLLSSGYLRQDARARDVSMGPEELTHNFSEIALSHEYGGSDTPLLRWEKPIRYSVGFGVSVDDAQRVRDRAAIGGYFARLARLSGLSIAPTGRDANFHVLVLSNGERRGIGQFLKTNVDGISNSAVNAILRMPANHYCMVVTIPHQDRSRGIKSAVAIVRAELAGQMRQSCIEEELAQGMGLPNDCRTARPSIFNDNEEFGVLTRHDEALMRMLYSAKLRSGMRRGDVLPIIQRLAAVAMR